jgi:PAS domain S-box-containing protein
MMASELFRFLQGTEEATFCLTEDGEIKYWNHAAEKLFGYTATETLHRNCCKLLEGRGVLGTKLGRTPFNLRTSDKGTKPIPNFDLEVKTRSGKRVWVNVSSIVSENSRTSPRLIVHFVHDISELKRHEMLMKNHEELVRELIKVSKELVDIRGTGKPLPVARLSEQEIRILRKLASGKQSPDIARNLVISPATLRNHVHHINEKLGTHNRFEAVVHAIHRKLI